MEDILANLENLETRFWGETIICHPELESQCPWGRLTSKDWHEILLEHPQFICHATKITPSFMTLKQWLEVLLRHPELDAYFPQEKSFYSEEKESLGELWGNLLARHPGFAKYGPWKSLRKEDWERVLSQQPQFIEHYENDRRKRKDSIYSLDSVGMAHVIACQPTLYPHFDSSTFYSGDWETILTNQPRFHNRCNFNKLIARTLGRLLARHPEWLSHLSTYAKTPKEIIVIAEDFPEILKHYELHRFAQLAHGNTPWMEKHPCLTKYTSWNFSYDYWDGFLTRLSEWLQTGRRPKIHSMLLADEELAPARPPKSHQPGEPCRPAPKNPKAKNLRNSLEPIMDFRYWVAAKDTCTSMEKLPRAVKCMLASHGLTYAQLMIQMSMLSQEDNGRIVYGLIVKNKQDVLEKMLQNNLSQILDFVPLDYILPGIIMYFSPEKIRDILPDIEEIAPNTIANFRDKAGNTALHYALFRKTIRPEEEFDDENPNYTYDDEGRHVDVTMLLLKHGANPDAPNHMGFSYHQIQQAMENYLRGE